MLLSSACRCLFIESIRYRSLHAMPSLLSQSCHCTCIERHNTTPQDLLPLLHVLDKSSGVFICYSLRRVGGSSMDDRSDPQLLAMHPATPAPRNADSDSYRLEMVPRRGYERESEIDGDGGRYSSFAHLSLSLKDWIHGESIFAPPHTSEGLLDPMMRTTCLSVTLLLHRSTPAVTVLIGGSVVQTMIPLQQLWTDDFAEFREEAGESVHLPDCSPAALEVVSISCRGHCFGLLDKVLLQHYLPLLWDAPFEAVIHTDRPVDRYPCCPCHLTEQRQRLPARTPNWQSIRF